MSGPQETHTYGNVFRLFPMLFTGTIFRLQHQRAIMGKFTSFFDTFSDGESTESPNAPRPGSNCPETLDISDDHLMHYLHARERTDRHYRLVAILTSGFAKDAQHRFIEPLPNEQYSTRPDIGAIRSTGGTDFFHVTFVNLPAPSNTRAPCFNLLTSLKAGKSPKFIRNLHFITAHARS